MGTLIRSMKSLSPEAALYLYKSTIRPSMEYWCHVWTVAPNCYLEFLYKLQKRICRVGGPSLAASLELLAQRRNVPSLSLFYITSVDIHLSWLNWLHFCIVEWGLLVILIDCMIFLLPFLNVTRMSLSTVSFLEHLGPVILSAIECFPLTYDLNCFNSRINRHLLFVGSLQRMFSIC